MWAHLAELHFGEVESSAELLDNCCLHCGPPSLPYVFVGLIARSIHATAGLLLSSCAYREQVPKHVDPSRSDVVEFRFSGRIAGFGTTAGTRIVVGMWQRSPFGSFTDVMLEDSRGHRTLLAPTAEIAEFISSTYSFDEVSIVPVTREGRGRALRVRAGELDVTMEIGRVAPLGLLMRLIPKRLATDPRWLTLIDPIARLILAGTRTAGTAGGGLSEYYGVTDVRRILTSRGTLDGDDLGRLAPLAPPVRFGFGSAPASPSMVDVVTTIR